MQLPNIKFPHIKPVHVFLLISVFLWVWVYTEVEERIEREKHRLAVDDFMTKGDRFTREDGKALEARLMATQAAMMGMNKRLIKMEDIERVEHDELQSEDTP